MKYILVFILVILMPVLIFAQDSLVIHIDTINRIDEKGLKQGTWKEYWENGKLWRQYNYVNGKKNGPYMSYEENGELRELGFYKQDQNVGYTFELKDDALWRSRIQLDSNVYPIFIEYFENQLPMTGGNYSGGSGEKISFYESGKIKSIVNYLNFKEEGFYTYYFQNGQLKENGIMKSEMPWTIFCMYDSLGNRIDYGSLIDGTGVLKKYYPNGKIKKVEMYKGGKYWATQKYMSITGQSMNGGNIKKGNGLMIEYYDNGSIKSNTTFLNGIRNGKYIEYYENGKKRLAGEYKNGKEEGRWILYNKREQAETDYIYKEGNNIGVEDYDTGGN